MLELVRVSIILTSFHITKFPSQKILDIWFFGTLIFELITGEMLLHSNKSRNIVNDIDIERLFSWTMADHAASRRLSDIDSPLGRHLL